MRLKCLKENINPAVKVAPKLRISFTPVLCVYLREELHRRESPQLLVSGKLKHFLGFLEMLIQKEECTSRELANLKA